MKKRDFNEICAKCQETVGAGHNENLGCLFVPGSNRNKYRPGAGFMKLPAKNTYQAPQFFSPTRIKGTLSGSQSEYIFGEDPELSETSFAGINREVATKVQEWNKACGTCSEAFPYDALPSNRPDGKTDCSRCRILKGVFT